MKKKMICVMLTAALLAGSLSGCGQNEVSYKDHLEDYVKTMDYHDGFTILQLTDIHWNSGTCVGGTNYGSEEYIQKVIDETIAHTGGIDLIEITGDTFMLANSRQVKSFLKFMESTGIPYATVWGNHDRQGRYNPNWLSRQFEEAEGSLYTEVDNDDVHERSNYVINLNDASGDTVWQLIELDTGASYRDGAADMSLTYDYMREDQLEWMTAEHDAVGSDVPVMCYYHIPQKDTEDAVAAYDAGTLDVKSAYVLGEGVSDSKYSPYTDDVFAANNVKGAMYGHDHANDWTFTSKSGIVYAYGVKTGTELYYGTEDGMDVIGGSVVTLENGSGDFTLEHLYINERDEGDFIEWVEY